MSAAACADQLGGAGARTGKPDHGRATTARGWAVDGFRRPGEESPGLGRSRGRQTAYILGGRDVNQSDYAFAAARVHEWSDGWRLEQARPIFGRKQLAVGPAYGLIVAGPRVLTGTLSWFPIVRPGFRLERGLSPPVRRTALQGHHT